MGKMMLHPDKRNAALFCQLLSVLRRVISGMKVADNGLRLPLEERFHPPGRLCKRPDRPGIRKVADIGGRIKQRPYSNAEGVLQLAARREHRLFVIAAGKNRKRRISP